MKTTITKIIASFFLLLLLSNTYGQSPKAFNYQAVARDAAGNVMQSVSLGIRVSIHLGDAAGPVVYQETFAPVTNDFGLFTLAVGTGTVVDGLFDTIAWGKNHYWMQVEMDPPGATPYTDMGTSQLLSVPYAMYAERTPSIGFSAWASTTQTLSNTQVAFDTEEYDDGDNFASNSFTAPRDGVYHFNANVRMTGNATAGVYCWLAFMVNGDNRKASTTQTSTNTWGILVSADLKLQAGDVVTVQYYGPSLSTIHAFQMNTWFTGHLVY